MTTISSTYTEIVNRLSQLSDDYKAQVIYPRFFKTGKVEYGEGDRFIGVTVPMTRSVAKLMAAQSTLADVDSLLQSKVHEHRLCALLILVAKAHRALPELQAEIVNFYLCHSSYVNNWDLVDLSAPYILGNYLLTNPRQVLRTLTSSPSLWDNRIAVVSTLTLIRHNDYADILELAHHHASALRLHDLMQKAVGWMLREVGKRSQVVLTDFLDTHAATMPRTMLRYSIEKLSPEQKQHYMNLKLQCK